MCWKFQQCFHRKQDHNFGSVCTCIITNSHPSAFGEPWISVWSKSACLHGDCVNQSVYLNVQYVLRPFLNEYAQYLYMGVNTLFGDKIVGWTGACIHLAGCNITPGFCVVLCVCNWKVELYLLRRLGSLYCMSHHSCVQYVLHM